MNSKYKKQLWKYDNSLNTIQYQKSKYKIAYTPRTQLYQNIQYLDNTRGPYAKKQTSGVTNDFFPPFPNVFILMLRLYFKTTTKEDQRK